MTERTALPVISLCEGCGNCCRSIGLPPFEVANPDLGPQPALRLADYYDGVLFDFDLFERMQSELRAEHAAMLRALESDPEGNPCAWLDVATGRCRHYEWRPYDCRMFVVGSHECNHIRERGAKCVWLDHVPPEVWRNPRSRLRYELRVVATESAPEAQPL